jgi:hypothetical protein
MRNRTHWSDFPPFFSAHRKSQPSFPEAARVRISQRDRRVLGRCTGTISRETDLFWGLLAQMAAGRRFSPISNEAELTYDDFFRGKQTRVHVFVFLSCPIPF